MIKKTVIILLAVCSLIFIFGCNDLFVLPEIEVSEDAVIENMGFVSIYISGNSGRTIVPSIEQTNIIGYTLVFTNTGNNTVAYNEYHAKDSVMVITLSAGTYNLEVTAYSAYTDAANNKPVATGTEENIVLKEGEGVGVEISLTPLGASEIDPTKQGTFKWNINVTGIDTATMEIDPISAGATPKGDAVNLKTTGNGTRELNSGYYRVIINLGKMGIEPVIWRETLHVYQNMVSYYEYSFADFNFAAQKYSFTLYYNDGSTPAYTEMYLYGDVITDPGTPIRNNYEFAGWYMDPNLQNLWQYTSGMTITANIALYAKWISTITPDRQTIEDFENFTSAILVTTGSGNAEAGIVNDPVNAGEKSLQMSATDWNRGAVIPFNLPYALENYSTVSFRLYMKAKDGNTNNNFVIYARNNNSLTTDNGFNGHGFGNHSLPTDDEYYKPAYLEALVGETAVDFTLLNQWVNYEFNIVPTLAAVTAALSSPMYIALGVNNNGNIEFLIDDIAFTLKDDFIPPVQSATISPDTASFDKVASNTGTLTTTITLNGRTLTEIRNGASTVASANYSLSAASATQTVTFTNAYLKSLPVGNTQLTFVFDAGSNATYTVTVSDSTSATISPTSISFDKNSNSDITVTMNTNGNTLSNITNGGTQLTQGTGSQNYGVSGNTVTIRNAYLKTLPVGTTTLIFNFSGGNPCTLTINVTDNSGNLAVPIIVDFEADALNKTYSMTGGNGTASATVVADPGNAGQKSLQITSNGYNRGAIIPIFLPFELQDSKSFSFRIRANTSNISNQTVLVYAAKQTNQFLEYGFGNLAGNPDNYPQFESLMVGQVSISSITTGAWSSHTITITNPGNDIKSIGGNIYVAIGINNNSISYYVDDLTFTPKDGLILPPEPPGPPTRPLSPPSTGAVYSGSYRNMYLEYGKTQPEIDAKVNQVWNDLFTSTATGNEATRIYYEVSTPVGAGAYILDAGNNDIRSEGMSYAMMMAVQMNDKDKFDKLWRWARHYSYNTTNAGRNLRGFFTWAMNTDGSVKDLGCAPDGEFYFATALLFASARWGDNTGSGSDATMLNYRQHAMQLLYDMIHRDIPAKDPYNASGLYRRPGDDGTALPNTLLGGYHQPIFSPYGNSQDYTDPSYFLPAFNEIWAMELEADANAGRLHGIWLSAAAMREDAAFYKQAAVVAREFFKTTVYHPANPYSDRRAPTYLGPDYSEFNGLGRSPQAHFLYDAWRIAMNIAFDYAWFAEDPWQKTFADGIQAFFKSQGVNSYGSLWFLNGTLDTGHNGGAGTSHSPGLVACNAVTSLASTTPDTWLFLEDFWDAGLTKGQWRYYDGCLYMLGLLHVTGNFKAYLSTNTTPTPQPSITPTDTTYNKQTGGNITVNVTLNGHSFSNIQNGGVNLTQGTNYTISGSGDTRTVTLNSSYLLTLPTGTTTLTFNFSDNKSKTLSIAVTDTRPSSTISPTTAVFDKAAPVGIPVTITWNGNTFSGIQNGGTTLTANTHYSVSGNVYTITVAYLNAQPNGTTTLTFNFSAGQSQNLVITVKDSSASGGGGLSYDFSADVDVNYSGAGIIATVTTDGGDSVLKVERTTTNHATLWVILPFDLGSTTLSNYNLVVEFRGVSGDVTHKTFQVRVNGGSNIATHGTGGGSEWQTFTTSLTGSQTGAINIEFSLENAPGYVYHIRSIALVPK